MSLRLRRGSNAANTGSMLKKRTPYKKFVSIPLAIRSLFQSKFKV